MRIAVLGCGPAGLLAAHACWMFAQQDQGFVESLDVFSRKVKSPLYGAQYLHRPIPLATKTAPRVIDYRLRGTPEDYRRKVYGNHWNGEVSPQSLVGQHEAWDIREAYQNLWDMYEPIITDTELEPGGVRHLIKEYDLVFNTVPLNTICYSGCNFLSTHVTAAGDAPDLGIDIGSMFRTPDETVLCNAEESPAWYRLSRIFGHTTVEWPQSIERVPVTSASRVTKPMFHECKCWPTIVGLGRYGSWKKGVLSHHAYEGAIKELEKQLATAQAGA